MTEQNPESDHQSSPSQGRNTAGKGRAWRVFHGIFTGLSVLGNIIFLLLIIGIVVILASSRRNVFIEETVRDSAKKDKIVILNVRGIINNMQYRTLRRQIDKARADKNVRGLIVRVNSPGGTISGSDDIHHQIRQYRAETGEPVIALMQGMAASGGYYISAGCSQIVAEPTAITGSIGVIFSHVVVSELLEKELGIQPVIIKKGKRKDWPSPFRLPAPEELQYIESRIIDPSYQRFLTIVEQGRPSLSLEQVKSLADGSIYPADMALENKLIDKVGYLDDAVDEMADLTGIEDFRVVEYQRPFSFASLLRARSDPTPQLNRADLYEWTVPRLLYLWSGY